MSNLTNWYFVRQCSSPTTHYIKTGVSSIGRDITAFVVCSNIAVSKKHAIIAAGENKHVYIRDNHTTNGTFINDERVPPGQFCMLLEDDMISFAKPQCMIVDLNSEYCFKLMREKKHFDRSKDKEYIRHEKDLLEEQLERELREIHSIAQSTSQLNISDDIIVQSDPGAQKYLDELMKRACRKERFKTLRQKSFEYVDAEKTNYTTRCESSKGKELQESRNIVRQRSTEHVENIHKKVRQKYTDDNEIPAETVRQKSTEHSKSAEHQKIQETNEQPERKSESEINNLKETNHIARQDSNGNVELDVQLTSTGRQKSKASNEKIISTTERVWLKSIECKETNKRERSKSTSKKDKKLEDIDERVQPNATRNKELEQTLKSKSTEKMELNISKKDKKLEDIDERVQPNATRNKELEQTLKSKSTEKMELNITNDVEQTPGQKILEKTAERMKRKSIGQQQLEETIERVRQKIIAENMLQESRKRGRPKSTTKNKSNSTIEKSSQKSTGKKKSGETNDREQEKNARNQLVELDKTNKSKISKTTLQKPIVEKETNKTNKRISQKSKDDVKKIKLNPSPQKEKESNVTTYRKEIIERAKIVPSTKKKSEICNDFKTPEHIFPKDKRVKFPACDDLEKNNLGKIQRSVSMCGCLGEIEKKLPKRRQTIFIDPLPPIRRSPRTRSKTVAFPEPTTSVTEQSPTLTPMKSILKSPCASTNSSEIPLKDPERITLTLRKRSYSMYSVIPDNNKTKANEETPIIASEPPPIPKPIKKMKSYEFNDPRLAHYERRTSIAPIIMQRPPLLPETVHNRSFDNVKKMERSRSIIGYVDESHRNQMPRSKSIMGNVYSSDNIRASAYISSNMVQNENFLPEYYKTFLSHVIRWNPSWFEEYMRHDDTLPPIFHESKNDIPVMLYTYRNYEAYSDTITSLIILEVWEAAFTAYKAIRSSGEKLNFILCNQPPKAFVGTKITKITLKSKDKNVVSSRMGYGMLLLINFPELPKCVNRWFIGLIDTYEYKASIGRSKEVIMTVYVRLDPQLIERAQSYSLIHIKPLTSIKNEMAMVRAVYNLQLSELRNMIVSPKEIFFKKFQSLSPLQWKHQLNASQLKAVAQCICAISSNMPSIQIIQGPPGTGKSRVIVSIVMEYLQRTFRSQRGKVLICTQTNVAIDEIVKRLLECRRNMTCERKFSMVRVGRCDRMQPQSLEICSTVLAKNFDHNPDISNQFNIINNVSEIYKNTIVISVKPDVISGPGRLGNIKLLRMSINKFEKLRNIPGPQGAYSEVQHAHYTKKLDDLMTHSSTPGNLFNEEMCVIGEADVIATTLQGCSLTKLQVLRNKVAFCIVDEAAKATEPEILIPLSLGVKSLHLVGDHQQLSAFVSSHHAKKKGLSESLFSRLIHCCGCWEHACMVPLNVQYRMHPDIAHFPNLAFYEGKLKNGTDPPALPRKLPPYRVLYHKGNTKDQDESGVNSEEAKVVAKLSLAIDSYIRSEELNLSFSVITPYSAQKDAILTHLRSFSARSEIEVSTVDSFQGQERDVTVISCARSSGTGFLDDPGRMSVLLTRAKRSCIICCNPDALKKQSLWASLLEDADNRQMSRPLPRKIPHYINEEDNCKKFLQYLL